MLIFCPSSVLSQFSNLFSKQIGFQGSSQRIWKLPAARLEDMCNVIGYLQRVLGVSSACFGMTAAAPKVPAVRFKGSRNKSWGYLGIF